MRLRGRCEGTEDRALESDAYKSGRRGRSRDRTQPMRTGEVQSIRFRCILSAGLTYASSKKSRAWRRINLVRLGRVLTPSAVHLSVATNLNPIRLIIFALAYSPSELIC